MIPVSTLAKIATLGLSREKAEAVFEALLEVQEATDTELRAEMERAVERAKNAARQARYRAESPKESEQ